MNVVNLGRVMCPDCRHVYNEQRWPTCPRCWVRVLDVVSPHDAGPVRDPWLKRFLRRRLPRKAS